MIVISRTTSSCSRLRRHRGQNRYQIDKKKGQGAIVGGADVYMSDFGEMEIVPHYLMSGANYVLRPECRNTVMPSTCAASSPPRWARLG
jgi:hypothetical protein